MVQVYNAISKKPGATNFILYMANLLREQTFMVKKEIIIRNRAG